MLTSENLERTALESPDRVEELLGPEPISWHGVSGKAASRLLLPPAPKWHGEGYRLENQPVLALFCFEEPGSPIGRSVSLMVGALAQRPLTVHLFSRHEFEPSVAGVSNHVLGESPEGDVLGQAQDFGRRACNLFLKLFPADGTPITLMGCEWSAVSPLTILQGIRNYTVLLSLQSLERQRSDMTGELSKHIEEIELAGVRAAKAILVHDPGTAEALNGCAPECTDRIVSMPSIFPLEDFAAAVDAGRIKARFDVGPLDPMILYIGDLSEPYGPDILVKALPAVLKNHPQVRLVLVGGGDLYWPLRVYARYLLLEHAVRLAGSVEGQPLFELIQAADLIVVPSRASTPWWPILAGWAARRPVVASHEAAPDLLAPEQDSVLFYPNENSCVWGVERILYDAELAKSLAGQGHEKLLDRFGWKGVAGRIEQLMEVPAIR